MNINNWLCKHFDEEKKGFVILGDVLNKVVLYLLLTVIGVGILYVLYCGVLFMYNIKYEMSSSAPINKSGFFGAAIIIVFCLVLISELYKYISKIKIAKCPLKEGDTK